MSPVATDVIQSDVDSSVWLRRERTEAGEPDVLMLGVGNHVSPYTNVEIIVTRKMAEQLRDRLDAYLEAAGTSSRGKHARAPFCRVEEVTGPRVAKPRPRRRSPV